MFTLPIKVETRPDGIDLTPRRGSDMAVGYDLRANIKTELVIASGKTVFVPTGVRLDMSAHPNMVAMVYPRSGLGAKQGLVLGNGTGVVDPDYQGEIMVALWNRNQIDVLAGMAASNRTIQPGDRIAQIVFLPAVVPFLAPVAAFETKTERGENGFGSTGLK